MRRYLFWVFGLAIALGAGSIALAANSQKLSGQFTPGKTPESKRVGGEMRVAARTGCEPGCSGAGAIKPMTRMRLLLDDDFRFFSRGLPVCRPSRVDAPGTSTAEAKAACGKAQVGSGRGDVAIAGDPTGAEAHAVITVFNGPRKAGRPTIVMHGWDEAFRFGAVFTAVLRNLRGDLGWRVDLTVPELPGSSALRTVEFSLKRSYRFRGERVSFVSARCGDRNRTWNFKGVFTYQDNPTLVATSVQRCKVSG